MIGLLRLRAIAGRLSHALRDASWFDAERAVAYGRCVAVMITIQYIHLIWREIHSTTLDPMGRAEPLDFNGFWSASWLVLQGKALLVYDIPAMRAAQLVAAQPAGGKFLPYLYPPVFTLFCAPLALLPYLPAMAMFCLGGFSAAVVLLKRILPQAWPWVAVLALPVAMVNTTQGQTGAIALLCFGGALLLLDRRPVLAGLCLAGLVLKPHMAVCVPVALIAAERWRALVAAGLGVLALVASSWAVFGAQAWLAFRTNMPVAHQLLEYRDVWPKLLSVYAAIRVLHGPLWLAYAAQAIAAAAALVCLFRLCRSRPGAGAEVSAMVLAMTLCTPYLFDYDLFCLGVPMAWMAGRGSGAGWRPWEKSVLVLLYMYPLLARIANESAGLPLTPLLTVAAFVLVLQRAARSPSEAGTCSIAG